VLDLARVFFGILRIDAENLHEKADDDLPLRQDSAYQFQAFTGQGNSVVLSNFDEVVFTEGTQLE